MHLQLRSFVNIMMTIHVLRGPENSIASSWWSSEVDMADPKQKHLY